MSASDDLEWMLWRVDDGQRDDPPTANLIRAIQHYSEKYGRVPNRCEVAPDWADKLKALPGMVVGASKKVRPFHFLLTFDAGLDSADGAGNMIAGRKNQI